MNHAIEVQQLSKRIGNVLIVDNVSFQIEKGEIFGLLGPNGAGKTTIIRMIVNLINRTNGKVLVDGIDTESSYSEAMSKIGAIVENPEFYKYMSGYQNLMHYARMATSKISKEKIKEIIKLVDLEDAIHKKVKTYSLGMRQRLGVAQALLHDPTVLILDEPTNGLDPQGIREFREHLRYLAEKGIAILISSHLLSEIEMMCDRYIIIEKGKLIHSASLKDQVETDLSEILEVTFKVNDAHAAIEIIKAQETIIPELKSSTTLTVFTTYEQIAAINALLVKNDQLVYEINITKKSLEDHFIEITKSSHEKAVKS